MYAYEVLFKCVRCLQDNDSFNFALNCVTVTYNNKKSWVRINYSAMRRNPMFCLVSPVYPNLYGQSLNDFNIFLARKYT